FRHLAYEGYKAQRKGMPEELAVQMPILKDVLDAMNIPRYELEGWEADDLIGTISRICEEAGWETVAVTGDKDSLQLVDDHVTVKLVSTRMGQTTTKDMTPAAFREEYGFDPIHIIDLKALMGDSSDNIPGVKGIGEKTAMGLVQLYHTIDHLYEHMPHICQAPDTPAKPGVVKKLEEGEADARMSYDLATIRRNAPIAFRPEDALCRESNGPVLYELLLKLEFSKLIDKLGLHPGPAGGPAKEEAYVGTCESEVVGSRERMEELLALWRQKDHVTLLALPDLNGICVEYGTENEGKAALFFPERLECYNDFLHGLFAPDIRKVSHGVKNLMCAFLPEGLSLEGFVFDTELAAYLLDPTAGSYDLERLSVSYFNFETRKAGEYLAPDAFSSLFTFGEPSAQEAAGPMGAFLSHTALIDALYGELSRRLEELDMMGILTDLELPLCVVLAEMERAGVLVDRKALHDFGVVLDEQIKLDEQ
ncbi:MAG: DNA polymerase I, partial [Oscillospiraceae bacterium]|nr:DNA polymerase I [Oscillospiraceae bacterium]